MKNLFKQSGPKLISTIVVVIVAAIPLTTAPLPTYAQHDIPLPEPVTGAATIVTADPWLHNPYFDNDIWYEFHLRHAPSYPKGVWLPDGNWYGDPQDWRLWFQDGTSLVDCDPHSTDKHSGSHSVQCRAIDPSAHIVTGLYQIVPNVVPCRTYQFQMYSKSRPKESNDLLNGLRVGIAPTGWGLDPDHAPGVHDGDWPATMAWGAYRYETGAYLPLVATAEALNTTITVFSYADAVGGNSHKIHWDTTSLQDVTPAELLSDPDNPSGSSSGISGLTVDNITTISARVRWNTSSEAISQVYYRFIPTPSPPVTPTGTLLYAVYLPFISNQQRHSWNHTTLTDSAQTYHSVQLTDLLPGSTYAYIVAARGVSGSACVTWVKEGTFTTREN